VEGSKDEAEPKPRNPPLNQSGCPFFQAPGNFLVGHRHSRRQNDFCSLEETEMDMTIRRTLRFGGVACICLGTLAACGGGGGSSGMTTGQQTSSGYAVQALVSDKTSVAAAHTDAHLINPWGIAFGPGLPVWVADAGTSVSTLYDGGGAINPLIVTFPAGSDGNARPTGIVFNPTSDFVITPTAGAASAPATFIFDGLSGTLTAWSSSISGTQATQVYDDGAGHAEYKGLALATCGGANVLYATDFHNAKIDTFNSSFQKVGASGNFRDPQLPAGYAPFNIQRIGSLLYVTYAQPMPPANLIEVLGPGLGVVDEFDACGNFVKRFATGGALNAPWGVALAPANFGMFSNTLLIGNFGDGAINAFDPNSGQLIGAVKTPTGASIQYPGLWGMAFGNGAFNQPSNTLFFAAGINKVQDGIYGRIDPASISTAPVPAPGGNPYVPPKTPTGGTTTGGGTIMGGGGIHY
jgi:uncharacterized protein (TIGR03118 family)